MKTLATFDQGNAYPVKWEYGNGEHRITYGLQQTSYRDDIAACREYGECVRHALECEGAFNDDDEHAELNRDLGVVDITTDNHGSIVIVEPLTPAGRDWLADHISEDAQRWGEEGYVVEPRYVQPILEGAAEDGLTVG